MRTLSKEETDRLYAFQNKDVIQLRSHDIEHSNSVDLLETEEHFEPTDPKESEMSFPVAAPTEEITIEENKLEIEN